ncbi:MAG: histidine kinase [Myxococcales bacterium]|nr:histidine kinase [Myxococcales bacterium]
MPMKRPSSPMLHAAPARRELVPLAVVADHVAREYLAGAELRSVRLKLRLRSTPLVLGDTAALFRVLANLLENAIASAPPATTVLVEIDSAGPRATIDILDEGPGVPLELRQVVFQPFYTTTADAGGLGLTVARSIVHSHGGQIGFVDCGYGHVRVELPCAISPVAERLN